MLGNQIAVLENGRVTQLGGRDEFLRRPRSSYVAAFLGINLFRGRIVERRPDGLVRVAAERGELLCVAPAGDDENVVMTGVTPSLVALHRVCPEGQKMNIVRGAIVGVSPGNAGGVNAFVSRSMASSRWSRRSAAIWERLSLREGEVVWASFEAAEVGCYS